MGYYDENLTLKNQLYLNYRYSFFPVSGPISFWVTTFIVPVIGRTKDGDISLVHLTKWFYQQMITYLVSRNGFCKTKKKVIKTQTNKKNPQNTLHYKHASKIPIFKKVSRYKNKKGQTHHKIKNLLFSTDKKNKVFQSPLFTDDCKI